MPKSKGRGKKYMPKPASLNSIDWAMAGAHLLPESRRAELFGPVAEAFACLREGSATLEQWYTIENGLHLSEALIGLNIGNNLAPQIAEGRRALDAVGARMRATGSSTCGAPELAAIREAIDLYRIQIGLCTQGEMSKAVRQVQRQINSAGLAVEACEEKCNA
jgi:hypothetical protein